MSTQDTRERLELLQGTLDLLILRTLIFGSQHGQGIARAIQETSEKELLVEHGALCDLFEARTVVPVIDRRRPLSDVAEALRFLEQGHAQGKVVITVDHRNEP
jgi:NADPH:quinone reductase-like Zn-dependent oxidoreductase